MRSLELQGGRFTPVEAERCIAAPYACDAVKLRRWDDQAKVPGKITPVLEHFIHYLQKCV